MIGPLQPRTTNCIFPAAVLVALCVFTVSAHRAHAQATAPKAKAPAASKSGAAPARPAAPATKAAQPSAEDSAARDKILGSESWKQTIASFGQWLDTQTMYDAQEVQQTKSRLAVGIGRMNAAQLQWFEKDLQEKLRILTSEQAQEAGTYVTQTLAVASPAFARKLRQKLPDLLTTTAAQVNQQLASFAAKRQSTAQAQQAFTDSRQQQLAFNQTQIAEQQQILNKDLDRESDAAKNATKGNDFKQARDYFPNAGNDGPFGPGTSVGFWGGGFF